MAVQSRHLVIFGCGYIGTAVALDALTRGVVVTALTRNEASAIVLREQGIEVVVADLADESWHKRVPGAPDFVLNCVSSGGNGLAGYEHSYVRGMAAIVAWARRFPKPGTLVYTSSTAVYPQGGGAIIDETMATASSADGERAGLLARAEEKIRHEGDAFGRWFILRLAGIYGPGRHHLLDQVRRGEVSGMEETRLNLIQREDVVSAIRSCFDAREAIVDQTFNVADDGPETKLEVVRWLAARLGCAVPSFSGKPAGTRRQVTPDRIISNRKLKQALGWAPRFPSFREGFSALGPSRPPGE